MSRFTFDRDMPSIWPSPPRGDVVEDEVLRLPVRPAEALSEELDHPPSQHRVRLDGQPEHGGLHAEELAFVHGLGVHDPRPVVDDPGLTEDLVRPGDGEELAVARRTV